MSNHWRATTTPSPWRAKATTRKNTAVKIAGWILLGGLVLIYAGGVLLGATATVTLTLVWVLELIGVVVIPVAGGAVLLWFAYKLFLEPVIRQRRLDRIREWRSRRDVNLTTNDTDQTDSH